jgi:hypothetical protein
LLASTGSMHIVHRGQSSTSNSPSKHSPPGGEDNLNPMLRENNSNGKKATTYEQRFCGFCSKPFRYRGSYSEHMKEQCHLRLLKSPFDREYICRFCPCPSFEDVDSVICHLWDNHSLDVGNLTFYEHCTDCYWRNSFFDIPGQANAAFDSIQGTGEIQDNDHRTISKVWNDTCGKTEYMGDVQSSNGPSEIARSGCFDEFKTSITMADYHLNS